MTGLEQRSKDRRSRIVVSKVSLHSSDHHSFHPELSCEEAWELLARLSKERWREETGREASNRVDKSALKIIRKDA